MSKQQFFRATLPPERCHARVIEWKTGFSTDLSWAEVVLHSGREWFLAFSIESSAREKVVLCPVCHNAGVPYVPNVSRMSHARKKVSLENDARYAETVCKFRSGILLCPLVNFFNFVRLPNSLKFGLLWGQLKHQVAWYVPYVPPRFFEYLEFYQTKNAQVRFFKRRILIGREPYKAYWYVGSFEEVINDFRRTNVPYVPYGTSLLGHLLFKIILTCFIEFELYW